MLSIPHLIIIFVVALVVFGPEKLPELARNLGKVMAEFRRATGDLKSTFEGHLRDLEQEAEQRRIGGGSSATHYQPAAPSPGAGATQANVPAPVPTSAPNAAERVTPSTSTSTDEQVSAPATADASTATRANNGDSGSTAPTEAREDSAESGTDTSHVDAPHATRS